MSSFEVANLTTGTLVFAVCYNYFQKQLWTQKAFAINYVK